MEYNEDKYWNSSEPIKLDVCAYSHDTVAQRHDGGPKNSVIPDTALELIHVAMFGQQARKFRRMRSRNSGLTYQKAQTCWLLLRHANLVRGCCWLLPHSGHAGASTADVVLSQRGEKRWAYGTSTHSVVVVDLRRSCFRRRPCACECVEVPLFTADL